MIRLARHLRRARPAALAAVTLALAALAALPGCSANPAAPLATPGPDRQGEPVPYAVSGTVTISPIHPVATPDEAQVAPLAGATIVVEDAQDAVVAQAVSGADGHYTVTLAAGSYRFVPQKYGAAIFPIPPQPAVVIVAGARADVDFDYDSGIR
jgi:hypothetical protein